MGIKLDEQYRKPADTSPNIEEEGCHPERSEGSSWGFERSDRVVDPSLRSG
jgi:hypothetical protein